MKIIKYKTKLTSDRKVSLEKEISINHPGLDRKLNSPDKVFRLAIDFLRMHEQTEEYVYMICLNTKLEFQSIFEISHGGIDSSMVGIREMFQKALLANAVNVIVLHNHPSGDPEPSKADIAITIRMVNAGDILGVTVMDHVIVGDLKYISLREEGYILKGGDTV